MAVVWLKKAAEQGNMVAQYNLGVCYNNGEGVEKDQEKSNYWLKKAEKEEVY